MYLNELLFGPEAVKKRALHMLFYSVVFVASLPNVNNSFLLVDSHSERCAAQFVPINNKKIERIGQTDSITNYIKPLTEGLKKFCKK